jgi:hypothetical protein
MLFYGKEKSQWCRNAESENEPAGSEAKRAGTEVILASAEIFN